MSYQCSGIYGLGIYSISAFLKELYKYISPKDVVLVTFGINLVKSKVLIFDGITSLKQSLNVIKSEHIIIVSDNPINLKQITNLEPIDFTNNFEIKKLKKITSKKRVFSFDTIDVIKQAVTNNSGSDFVTAYIQLISHAPDKHRQTLKITLSSFFKQGNLEETLDILRKLFPTSANFMATRFIYKLEEEGLAYQQAISSDLDDEKAAEKFKLEQYAIGFFRRQK